MKTAALSTRKREGSNLETDIIPIMPEIVEKLAWWKGSDCLKKDRKELLAFYDFPAEHWIHVRTTNPIESTFATVRLRTVMTRGCVSRETILAMVFKLVQSAEQSWRSGSGCSDHRRDHEEQEREYPIRALPMRQDAGYTCASDHFLLRINRVRLVPKKNVQKLQGICYEISS